MVARHLSRPHRFVCLTDQPWLIPAGIETVPIATPAGFGWWAKVELFNRRHGFSDRMLYLDLDSLVVAPLDPIVDVQSSFALVEPGGTFEGKDGLATVHRYNSSVMVWNPATQHRLFDKWTPQVAARLWGDQDWIGEQVTSADLFPSSWCPRLSAVAGPPFGDAKVILAKVPKNADAAKLFPWFAERWQ